MAYHFEKPTVIATIRRTLVLVILAAAVTLQGCGAVLTSSQVKEVGTFAAAAKEYGTFPGTVIRSHAELRVRQKLLEASTMTSGATALRQVEAAVDLRRELNRRAQAADGALEILNGYAALLVKLTGDQYTTDLQGSAESLGSSVDRAIDRYNKLRGTSLGSFGALAAAGVRGAGGIYIRHEQAEALQRAIIAADPVVETMIAEVERLLALYLAPADLAGLQLAIATGLPPEQHDLLRTVATDLSESYRRIADEAAGRQQLETVLVVADGLTGADDTIRLAVQALRAAESYRAAHRALVENVTARRGLKEGIEQVTTLVNEVNAANKLRKKLATK